MNYINDDYITDIIHLRDRDAHKGDFGRVLIFAGSLGMAGAAILCGRAALKTGSGLVRFLLPSFENEIYPILQAAVPEATCISFKESPSLDEYDAIAAGSGIGQSNEAKKILKYILSEYKKGTLVLDADALNIISNDPALSKLVKVSSASVIITPHVGEAKRLLNTCAGISTVTDRKNAAYDLASKYNCIAILKGSGTLMVDKIKISGSLDPFYQNTTGNPGMATGGSGDTLSGMIASLSGQGYAPFDAAKVGVFIHGKAGDIAADRSCEMSITAGDILDNIPSALKVYYM